MGSVRCEEIVGFDDRVDVFGGIAAEVGGQRSGVEHADLDVTPVDRRLDREVSWDVGGFEFRPKRVSEPVDLNERVRHLDDPERTVRASEARNLVDVDDRAGQRTAPRRSSG